MFYTVVGPKQLVPVLGVVIVMYIFSLIVDYFSYLHGYILQSFHSISRPKFYTIFFHIVSKLQTFTSTEKHQQRNGQYSFARSANRALLKMFGSLNIFGTGSLRPCYM